MKIEFNVYERDVLLQLIPPQVGSYSEMMAARRFRDLIGFSAQEADSVEMSRDDEKNVVQWNRALGEKHVRTFELTPDIEDVITKGVTFFFALGKIPTDPRFIDLIEKLVESRLVEPPTNGQQAPDPQAGTAEPG